MKMTGYFGKQSSIPGGTGRATNVHFVDNGKPLCGYRPARGYTFQSCSHGWHARYIECAKCRRIANAELCGESASPQK